MLLHVLIDDVQAFFLKTKCLPSLAHMLQNIKRARGGGKDGYGVSNLGIQGVAVLQQEQLNDVFFVFEDLQTWCW